jgi:hypothetical protein
MRKQRRADNVPERSRKKGTNPELAGSLGLTHF